VVKENQVEYTIELYTGEAGECSSGATLRSRLIKYMKFGTGEFVGHWGG